ncbi:MAG: hypothetical protein PWP04_502 [Candidatus Atribacteria bacterium]|nr:hypothetical protein [Candidatus Atribacteria bacterium]
MVKSKRFLPFLLFFIFFLSLLYLVLQAHLVEKGFLVETEREKVEVLKAEKEKLEVEVAQLASLDRIYYLAVSELGMIPQGQSLYLVAGYQVAEIAGSSEIAYRLPEMEGDRGQ